jgi:hypothetical protein
MGIELTKYLRLVYRIVRHFCQDIGIKMTHVLNMNNKTIKHTTFISKRTNIYRPHLF